MKGGGGGKYPIAAGGAPARRAGRAVHAAVRRVFPQVIPRPAKTVSDHRIARAAVRLALALGVVGVVGAGDEAAAREQWRAVTGSALQERLSSPVDITWAENPLRHAVGGLARSQRVAVLIDRRVDPEQKLDIALEEVSLREAFEKIARSRGLGVSLLGPVLFVGPPKAAAQLRTVAALRDEDARRLPAAAAKKFAARKSMTWDDLATPRGLLAQLAAENGVKIAGLELVPHDLWAAADLPPLSWTDRLTLVAIQFDLTFAISADGTAVRLAALPERVAVVRNYPGGDDPEATARKFAALAPGRKSSSPPARSPFAAWSRTRSGLARRGTRPTRRSRRRTGAGTPIASRSR